MWMSVLVGTFMNTDKLVGIFERHLVDGSKPNVFRNDHRRSAMEWLASERNMCIRLHTVRAQPAAAGP